MNQFDTEDQYVEYVLQQLNPHFHSRREIELRHHSGRILRVDAVLWPRDSAEWRDEKPVFAVEFKLPSKVGGGHDCRWAAQCVDYAQSYVVGHPDRQLKVFACPGFKFWDHLGKANATQWHDGDAIRHLLWQLGVGELVYIPNSINARTGTRKPHGWELRHSGHHRLWSEWGGVHDNSISLDPKIGSR